MFAVGCGLLVSALYVRYRDIQSIWTAVVRGSFYASPVLFPRRALSRQFHFMLFLNPPAPRSSTRACGYSTRTRPRMARRWGLIYYLGPALIDWDLRPGRLVLLPASAGGRGGAIAAIVRRPGRAGRRWESTRAGCGTEARPWRRRPSRARSSRPSAPSVSSVPSRRCSRRPAIQPAANGERSSAMRRSRARRLEPLRKRSQRMSRTRAKSAARQYS